MTLIRNTDIQARDSSSLDAFGRWRVSGLGTRLNCEFIHDKQPLLFLETLSGSGTATFNSDSRDITLAVNNNNSNDLSQFRQKWHNPYTPGLSQVIDITGTLNNSNITGGTTEIFLKDGINSTEYTYSQSSWTNDVEDVNWEYSQIFQMDFQSLKVGRIRFNLIRNGKIENLLELNNDNIKKTGYWQYPSLPITYQLYNTDTETISELGYFDDNNGFGFRYRIPKNSGATSRCICNTVKSEGGATLYDIEGYPFSADRGNNPQTVSTDLIPVISVRPKTLFKSIRNNSLIIPTSYNIQSDNPVLLKVILNPVLTNTDWYSVDYESAMEYDISGDTISDGYVILSEYIASGSRNAASGDGGLLGRKLLSLLPDDTQTIMTIAAVKTDTSDASMYGSIKWKEIR